MADQKVVLITGASTGIGLMTAILLASRGYRVFGTSRNPRQNHNYGFEMLPLDVTSDESVTACVQTVLDRAGCIDILVNNAGVDLFGSIEETSMEEARAVFETNFWGTVRMVKAVLPAMRERRDGQIINIGSAMGLVSWPYEGFYAATKYALEGYTLTLRYEAQVYNVRVTCVEPGFFKTNIGNASPVVAEYIEDYRRYSNRFVKLFRWGLEYGADPMKVAHAVQRLIENAKPPKQYRVGYDSVILTRLVHATPEAWWVKTGRWILGVDNVVTDMARGALVGVPTLIAGSVVARALKRLIRRK